MANEGAEEQGPSLQVLDYNQVLLRAARRCDDPVRPLHSRLNTERRWRFQNRYSFTALAFDPAHEL